ncbi:uncharacterized protein LOC122037567 isoform X1 [Zingiber officinale]|uniref:uncharacterized protein LOC122037567 isoform X1 n=1 Tax=Zingiber officinale TaxID=94328 RepID=UPI001C4D0012|nr:uncharacterized protein LOC122037567 isoform X1 [Zingiber officinale]
MFRVAVCEGRLGGKGFVAVSEGRPVRRVSLRWLKIRRLGCEGRLGAKGSLCRGSKYSGRNVFDSDKIIFERLQKEFDAACCSNWRCILSRVRKEIANLVTPARQSSFCLVYCLNIFTMPRQT